MSSATPKGKVLHYFKLGDSSHLVKDGASEPGGFDGANADKAEETSVLTISFVEGLTRDLFLA